MDLEVGRGRLQGADEQDRSEGVDGYESMGSFGFGLLTC